MLTSHPFDDVTPLDLRCYTDVTCLLLTATLLKDKRGSDQQACADDMDEESPAAPSAGPHFSFSELGQLMLQSPVIRSHPLTFTFSLGLLIT